MTILMPNQSLEPVNTDQTILLPDLPILNGTRNTMSKRGSPMLRKALYMAALKAICQQKDGSKVNPVLFEYYQNKCKGV